MNKQTLIWTLIIAVPVGIAALVTGYIYRETGDLPFQNESEVSAPQATTAGETTPNVAAAPDKAATPAAETSPSEEVAETPASPDAQVAVTADPAKPSFDVVGVEPTGETVVAGRSEAGAIVALTANGEVVGKSIANEVGEWTIILNEPLKPGDYDVGLETHDQNGEVISGSEERVAVSIAQGGKEQPLVVLNSPDGPSDILQKPETAAPSAVAEAPASSPDDTPKAKETVVAAAPGTDDQNSEAAVDKPAETAAADTGIAASADTGIAEEKTAAEDSETAANTPEKQPAEEQTPTASTEVAAASEKPATTETGQAGAVQSSEGDVTAGEETETADAATESASQEVSEGSQQVALATDAAQNDAPSATKSASSGASASEETASAPSATETSSSDQQLAAAPPSQPPSSSETPAPTNDSTAAGATSQTNDPTPSVTVEAVESEKDKVYVAGTGDPGSSVRVYVGDDYQGEAKVNSSGKWLVEGNKNVAEGNVEVRADMIGDDGSSVDARAAVVFEKEQDQQIVLTKVVVSGSGSSPDAQGAEVQKALPVVIIRKGDNLWRISRRLYGEGIRYTTIYQANQGQIRNPDLIYPGQVFLTPEGDLNWPKPDADNGRNG
ncbi:LysM peptidoglycan-binding domain-containing protein [Labrenzia sp. PHM005]|uniref:LysM peptidoglycan-binding domain-containing protein n=1 Tax=Labrenzia sp. PHM005 TaxID=2590016 RepID=UPI0011402A40|nr:LysM peptidoglycan-binding domain-containing protein [Labrenzia sp. PHM005]QDG78082.1 LysM peptidoglycan-binding domain-containing protein [Labrenzia sp. PHM005]